MKKFYPKVVLLLLLLNVFSNICSQAREDNFEDDPKGRRFVDRLYTGGNIGANFGTLSYFVDVSPILGYRVTRDFSVGIGAKYMYLGLTGVPNSGTSIYGGSVFSRYLFLKNFLAHAELETVNLPVQNQFSGEINREWVPIGLVGGGYRQSIGGFSYIQLMLLYDVIGDPRNPYLSPFGPQSRLYFRGGITIGL